MAQPTTSHPAPMPQQAATHGMGTSPASMAAPKAAAPVPQLDPVLVEGMDKVLLHRLYPDADNVSEAAMAAGKKTQAEGAALVAAQQEPPEVAR